MPSNVCPYHPWMSIPEGANQHIESVGAEVAAAKSTLANELLRVVEAVEPIAGRFAASDHKKRTLAAIRAECARLKVEVK